jgi:CheY-like chemotaxis protein
VGEVKSGFRVLVIDDSEIDREITGRHLGRAWPFERELVLDAAADGKEALEKIRVARYALIVLDWRLPLMGGGEVLRSIRQTGVRVPIVVISGLQRAQIADDIEALGATFLNKDEMNPSTFHDAIAESLRLLGHPAGAAARNPT